MDISGLSYDQMADVMCAPPAFLSDTGTAPFSEPQANERRQHRAGRDDGAMPRQMVRLVGILLRSCALESDVGCETLHPLWAEETMHRGYNLLKLTNLLTRRGASRPRGRRAGEAEARLAARLADRYRSLAMAPERRSAECAPVLRDLAAGLVTLFRPGVGSIELMAQIDPIALPGFQRRALGLAMCELIVNCMVHAFKPDRAGHIEVVLRRLDPWHARLTVSDDGVGHDRDLIDTVCGVAGGLAGLLAANLIYRRRAGGGTIAEVTFPLDCPTTAPGSRAHGR